MNLAIVVLLALTAPASARTVRGLVFDDRNGDGRPSVGEPGIAKAVVAFDVQQFTVTNAAGEFQLELPRDAKGIAWVRVPDGFIPGPVWTQVEGKEQLDLGLRRLAVPPSGPVTFIVAADTHITGAQPFADDLAGAVADATALEPRPAFFTILGDITQSDRDEQFDRVDAALAGVDVPYIPVPGNHDWYDGGATWLRRYGPDNYSFDIGNVHFVVWNMSMLEEDIEHYLGAELARVAPTMTIVALTHAPPSPNAIRVLHELGVDYVLTGHTHSNRVVDHDGMIELATEPMLMGGLDFTPGGYRVITLDRGALGAYHRTVVDAPLLEVLAPARGQCVATTGGSLIVATELDAGHAAVAARVDCGTPLTLRFAGGWSWRAELPALPAGRHAITVEARTPSGAHATRTVGFEVCDQVDPPGPGAPWPQLGGNAAHTGAAAHELVPPIVTRWTTTVGGHVLNAAPAIANGAVYVTATDLGVGGTGGVIALDLATGAVRWRAAMALPVRGGPAVLGDTVIATQLDGTVLGLDASSGAVRWRHELGLGVAPRGATTFGSPIIDDGDVLIGNQRKLAAIDRGRAMWTTDPVHDSEDFPSLASVASARGVAVGTFDRALGGVVAWDRATGSELWRFGGDLATAINASPVIGEDTVYLVNGLTEVIAVDLVTGDERWVTKVDPAGFDWGSATVATPALAHGVLVVPTLYRDLVALDATSGAVLWRFAGRPTPLRTTHYRGAGESGFEASPVITGDVVWAADTSGRLSALDLHTGAGLWHVDIGAPVLAGLAASGAWLVVASYDGTVRALVTTPGERAGAEPARCVVPEPGGCCDARSSTHSPLLAALVAIYLRARRRRSTSSARAIGHTDPGCDELHA